jgi:hypothetical protein
MASGGTTVRASSGAGGSSRASVASPPICTGVICPALPNSCKRILQDPTACCPVCADTGCPPCGEIKCAAGTHSETLPGDCCPTCVADPLDACKKGQKAYEDLRKQLLDKYGSTKCQNSLDCTLVTEINACTTTCNVPLPTSYATSYRDNLASSAKSNCASCPPQDPFTCERMVASCLNGKCVAVNPS